MQIDILAQECEVRQRLLDYHFWCWDISALCWAIVGGLTAIGRNIGRENGASSTVIEYQLPSGELTSSLDI